MLVTDSTIREMTLGFSLGWLGRRVAGVFFGACLTVGVVRPAGDLAPVLRGDLDTVVRAGLVVVVFLAIVLDLVVLLRGDAFAFAATVRLGAVDFRAFAVVVFFLVEPPVTRFELELFFAVELFADAFFLAGLLAAVRFFAVGFLPTVLFFAVGFLAREELDLLLAIFFFPADDFERDAEVVFFAPLLFDFFAPVEREPVDFLVVGIDHFPPDGFCESFN